VIEQKTIGKNHLKLLLAQSDDTRIKALAWRWGEYCPLPNRLDIAYKLKENTWNGNTTIEIELVGVRLPQENNNIKKAIFMHADKMYQCSFWDSLNEIRIKNERGEVLAVQKGQKIGLLGSNREQAQEVDVTQPHFYTLIKVAIKALEIY
jgi:single-stranded-DNA-specific exonuclease